MTPTVGGPLGDVAGQVAVVTGAASGIGAATATALAEYGATVVILDRDAGNAVAVRDRLKAQGLHAEHVLVDLAELDAIPAVVDDLYSRHGRIDILVNCAGVEGGQVGLVELDRKTWDRTLAVDLTAPFLLMQGCARAMIAGGRGGRIVNVTSSSAFRASLTDPDYASAKAGLVGLSRSAAGQLAKYHINVNCVAPGLTVTGMAEKLDPAVVQQFVESGPLENLFHRLSQPADVAAAIVFLCLPASRQITAQTVHTSAGSVVA